MNVLIIARGYPSKRYPLNGIFEFDQAKALVAAGCKVVYAAIDLRSIRRWRKWGLERIEKDGVNIYSINVPVGAVPKRVLYFIGRGAIIVAYHKIKKFFGRPDIVHAHFLDEGFIAATLCKQTNLPLVITEHSSKWDSGSLSKKDIVKAKELYSFADSLICVSNSLKNRIESYTGVSSIVIPNIVNMPQVDRIKKAKDKDSFYFVSAGNLVDGKGFDVLIKSFSKVLIEYPNAHLTIMGEGPKHRDLETLAKNLRILDNVYFFGIYNRLQFANELSKSDAFVLASRHETFGVVYAEAMSSGTPVIATRCGGPEDFVTLDTGILVQTENIDELSTAMLTMIKKVDIFNSKSIKSYACQKFSSNAIANKIIEEYKSVISNRSV